MPYSASALQLSRQGKKKKKNPSQGARQVADTASAATLPPTPTLLTTALKPPLIDRQKPIERPPPPSPRELANQIFGVFSKFSEALDEAKPLLLVGGTSVDDCLAAFRKGGAGILVGTPGRVEDMLNNYNVFDTRGEERQDDGGGGEGERYRCKVTFMQQIPYNVFTWKPTPQSPFRYYLFAGRLSIFDPLSLDSYQ